MKAVHGGALLELTECLTRGGSTGARAESAAAIDALCAAGGQHVRIKAPQSGMLVPALELCEAGMTIQDAFMGAVSAAPIERERVSVCAYLIRTPQYPKPRSPTNLKRPLSNKILSSMRLQGPITWNSQVETRGVVNILNASVLGVNLSIGFGSPEGKDFLWKNKRNKRNKKSRIKEKEKRRMIKAPALHQDE
eukprot:328356-Prorocentrum_minimum.AAC.2